MRRLPRACNSTPSSLASRRRWRPLGPTRLRYRVVVIELERRIEDRVGGGGWMIRVGVLLLQALVSAHLNDHAALPRSVVEIEQHDLLPGAEQQSPLYHGYHQRWAEQGRAHV